MSIKRAIKVACGIDHTIVLIGASIPSFDLHEDNNSEITTNEINSQVNTNSPPPLKYLCELTLAKSSNLRNIISVLNISKYFDCFYLYKFAIKFILWYEEYFIYLNNYKFI